MQSDVSGNIGFVLDPASSISLRAVVRDHIFGAVHPDAQPIRFLPFADGIDPNTHTDSNDFAEMPKNLGCSLTQTCNL